MVHCRKYNREIEFGPDEKCKSYSISCVGCPQPHEVLKNCLNCKHRFECEDTAETITECIDWEEIESIPKIIAPKPYPDCPENCPDNDCETCVANGYYEKGQQ